MISIAGEARHIAHFFHFTNDRVFRAALNNAAFMLSDRAESAAAKAAAHDVDREANHLVGRNACALIGWMWYAGIRQIEDVVHLFGGQRNWRWVEPDVIFTVALN